MRERGCPHGGPVYRARLVSRMRAELASGALERRSDEAIEALLSGRRSGLIGALQG